ncbi:hypothetical protein YC2023_075832 [Brassica napus]
MPSYRVKKCLHTSLTELVQEVPYDSNVSSSILQIQSLHLAVRIQELSRVCLVGVNRTASVSHMDQSSAICLDITGLIHFVRFSPTGESYASGILQTTPNQEENNKRVKHSVDLPK